MQSRPRQMVPSETYSTCFALVLFCGLALLLSIRPGGRIGDLPESVWSPSPSLFFLVDTLFLTLLGIHRGTRAAEMPGQRRAFRSAAGTLLVAEFLLSPYLSFLAASLEGGALRILLPTAYALLLAFAWALVSWRISHRVSRSPRALAGKLSALAGFLILPLVFRFAPTGLRSLSLVSPIGAVSELSSAPSLKSLAIVFGSTSLLLVGSALGATRIFHRRTHA